MSNADVRTVVERKQYTNGAARNSVPKGGSDEERRCWNCNKFLMKTQDFSGRIEISCHRCRRTNMITGDGSAARVAPDVMEVFVAMEKRWDEQAKSRAVRRAEMAVGIRFAVFMRDQFRCCYCGRAASDGIALHADHVLPQSRGGPTTLDNLVTACLDCNLGKSDKLL